MRRVRILPADMVLSRGSGDCLYARSPHAIGAYPARLTDRLDDWAATAPDKTLLAERDATGGWRRLTYGEARRRARQLAQALVDRGLSIDCPIVILSGPSLDHAVVALGAMYAGIPYAPLSPAYSQLSTDFSALHFLFDRLRPGLVFASDGPSFERALTLATRYGAETSTSTPVRSMPTTPLSDLEATTPGGALDEAHARVGPDTVAKILFTSGSTGHPKGVINTQRMLCANQAQIAAVLQFLQDRPPVLCDWLPWNHTFGGNHNFGIALYNGGTLYIDSGRPVPGLFDRTVENLRDVRPTAYFNVPRGFEMLLPVLRADADFCRHFFKDLQILFYAAAGLRQAVADEFVDLAIDACGERIPWVTGLGATETAPFALCTGAQMSLTSRIGVPVPGVAIKIAPVDGKLEVRISGPNVTPGYWRDEALTRQAFDDEGYYRMGDAVAFADAEDPLQGFVFEGRLAEDFKLSTGTWVRVGALRARLLSALGDLAQDVVIAGHARERLGALIVPNVSGWRQHADATGDQRLEELILHEGTRTTLLGRLVAFARANPGHSTAIRRAIVLDAPLSLDAGEITDKGSLNQRAVLDARAHLVERLYLPTPPSDVLDIHPEESAP